MQCSDVSNQCCRLPCPCHAAANSRCQHSTTAMPATRRRHLHPALIVFWIVSVASVFMVSLWSCASIKQTLFQLPSSTPSTVYQPTVAATTSIHTASSSLTRDSSTHPVSDCSRTEAAAAAGADSEAVPAPAELLSTFEGQWGEQSCVVLNNACMDEGTFVTFGDNPYVPLHGKIYSIDSRSSSSTTGQSSTANTLKSPSNTASITSESSTFSSSRGQQQPPWHRFQLGHNHLDFAGVGDVAGLIQYPPPIIRPGGLDEESPDLQPPHTFSECVRPVVFYLNFVGMFGDWWLRSMPTFMHALAAGAWDRRYAIILATGGQKLQRWQKLVLQSLTDHPVVSLSAASSRALAVQHTTARQLAAAAAAAKGGRAALAHAAAPAAAQNIPGSNVDQQQRQEQQGNTVQQLQARTLQQRPDAGTAAASVPVTAYGRCFELLPVCSISDARTFPLKVSNETLDGSSSSSGSGPVSSSSSTVVPRETWAGAQYVKQYYMQRYAQQYHHLPPQYTRLQEKGAFRVVFAVRTPAAAAAGGGSRGGVVVHGSSSSNGIRQGIDPTEDHLVVSTRQVLNIQELLKWCNAWKPTAATAADLQGIDSEAAAAAAAAAAGVGAERYTHAVCVAHDFGRHGRVDVAPTSSSGSSTGSSSGSTSGSSSGSSDDSIGRWLRVGALRLRQLLAKGHRAERAAESAQARANAQMTYTQQQQQQQQQWAGGDPELDPRALMTDLAVLDHADVVVGLHGAQLYNALFMPQHKTLVEVRPHGFTGGWPQTYFYDPLAKIDKDDGILWFGIDTVNASNSRPGRWEREGVGVQGTYARDRHTRIEPAALEVLFRRILWAGEDPSAYKELKYAGLTHITDTLHPAQQYHAAVQKGAAAAATAAKQELLQRPELEAARKAAIEAG